MQCRNLAVDGMNALGCIALGLVLAAFPAAAADDERELQGSVEFLYRNVSLDGSSEKYNEDFDGLASGVRLAHFAVDWTSESKMVDYASLNVSGLGGDPYETSSLRMGRKDAYDLKIRYFKQDYLYNLFELVSNEDGAFWDAQRTMTHIDLKVYPSSKVQLLFQFQQGRRTGRSLFMKDINYDLFRLETPLDQTSNTYTAGADFAVGPVDIVFRQTLRRYNNQFDNSARGDVGLEGATTLDSYSWIQNDSGGSDLTTLKVTTPLGDRVRLSASLFGTLLGEDELETGVLVNQQGMGEPFPGAGFTAPIPIVDGTSHSALKGDHQLVDVDLSVRIVDPLFVHVQYRSLDRDLDGTLTRDLDGDGVEDDVDGDLVPGNTVTRIDYQVDTLSAFADYRPNRKVGVKLGYRTIDRELMRSGFGGLRDTYFKSDGDETLIVGLTVRPIDWFKLNATYEDGDVKQPFNAVAPQEQQHTRVQATFTPQDDMRINLDYVDFDSTNLAPDLRDPGTNYDADSDGSTRAIAFWHRPNSRVEYMLRYAEQDIDTRVGVAFDTAGFAGVALGDSIFSNDNTQFSAQVNYAFSKAWAVHARYVTTESDGSNLLIGDVGGLVNDEKIAQDYEDAEIGVRRNFDSGLFLGASIRDFSYDDGGLRRDGTGTVLFRQNKLDYDGQIFTIRAGLTF